MTARTSAGISATAQHEGANNITLRLVPEIHFGPIKRTFQTVPNAAAIGPQEFQINNGQEEDTIRELATSLTLEPGQIAVIGCRPELKCGLGTLFFTQAVANSDQRMQKLILIWASRNLQGMGANDRNSKAKERPSLFKRLVGPAPPADRPEVESADDAHAGNRRGAPGPEFVAGACPDDQTGDHVRFDDRGAANSSAAAKTNPMP